VDPDLPCSRCEVLGKSCGEKSRRRKDSAIRPIIENSNPSASGKSLIPDQLEERRGLETGLKLAPRKYLPSFKPPDGFELDKVAIVNDAIKILERYYNTVDKEKIASMVRDVLDSFVVVVENHESAPASPASPASTISTEPKCASRNSTPDPPFKGLLHVCPIVPVSNIIVRIPCVCCKKVG